MPAPQVPNLISQSATNTAPIRRSVADDVAKTPSTTASSGLALNLVIDTDTGMEVGDDDVQVVGTAKSTNPPGKFSSKSSKRRQSVIVGPDGSRAVQLSHYDDLLNQPVDPV